MAAILRDRTLDPGRRRVLRDLALGTFGLGALHGAARAQASGPCGPLVDFDRQLLWSEVRMERVAVVMYDALSPYLSEPVRWAGELFRDHHAQHLAEASALLQAAGEALPPEVEPELPAVELTDTGILTVALSVETQAVSTYVGLVSQLADERLRVSAADIMGCEVGHVVTLRAALAGPPEPATLAALQSGAAFAFLRELDSSRGG